MSLEYQHKRGKKVQGEEVIIGVRQVVEINQKHHRPEKNSHPNIPLLQNKPYRHKTNEPCHNHEKHYEIDTVFTRERAGYCLRPGIKRRLAGSVVNSS